MAKYNYIFTIPGVSQPITFPAVSNEDDSKSTEGISRFFGNMKDKATLNKIKPYRGELEKIFKESYKEYRKACELLEKVKILPKIKSICSKIKEECLLRFMDIFDEDKFVEHSIWCVGRAIQYGKKLLLDFSIPIQYLHLWLVPLDKTFDEPHNSQCKLICENINKMIEETNIVLQKKIDGVTCNTDLYSIDDLLKFFPNMDLDNEERGYTVLCSMVLIVMPPLPEYLVTALMKV
jgi:hypothetical protein